MLWISSLSKFPGVKYRFFSIFEGIATAHDHDHFLALSLCDQIVHDKVRLPMPDPSGLVSLLRHAAGTIPDIFHLLLHIHKVYRHNIPSRWLLTFEAVLQMLTVP